MKFTGIRKLFYCGVCALSFAVALGLSFTGNAFAETAESTVKTDNGSEFKLSLGTLILQRESGDDHILARRYQHSGKVFLNSNEYDFDYSPGVNLSASYKTPKGLEANMRYFIVDWNDGTAGKDLNSGIVWMQYQRPGIYLVRGDIGLSSNYSSSLDSLEFNFGWWPIEQLGVFVGPRRITLNEQLEIKSTLNGFFGTRTLSDTSHVENELWGGQLGLKGVLFKTTGGTDSSLWGNVGYYNNSIDADMVRKGELDTWRANGSSHTGSIAGEAGLDFNLAIMPKTLFLNAGYEMLWVQKVAIAPAQYEVSDVFISHRTRVATDDALYHGAKVALSVKW